MTLDEIIQKLRADANWVPGPDASDRVWELYEQALIEVEQDPEDTVAGDELFLGDVEDGEIGDVENFLEEPEEDLDELGEEESLGGLDALAEDDAPITLDDELGPPTDYSDIDAEAEY